MATLTITIIPFNVADSCVPRISTSESTTIINNAGKFIIPFTPYNDV